MKDWKKIAIIWLSSVAVFVGLLVFPHEGYKNSELISCSLQLLLFIVSVFISRREPTKKNKYIFINFAVFFSLSIPFYLYIFVGTIFFPYEPFARFYVIQYVAWGAYFLFLAFALVYLTIDGLFREFTTLKKYILALAIVGGFFGYYYYPYFANPKYLYHTADVLDWKTLEQASSSYQEQYGVDPTPEQLAETVQLYSWKDGQPVGTLFPEEKVKRVAELYPYLSGSNYVTLLYRPIYFNTIYMCVLSVGFILLFFGYQYMKDPPQGAYIDKIMFLLLIFCTMEILHSWSFIKSVEWQSFSEILGLSQYVSVGILMLFVVYFGLRLRFITSVKGEFYEQEILASPNGVTRWRDALDNFVIAHFFNRNTIFGRLFVDPRADQLTRNTTR